MANAQTRMTITHSSTETIGTIQDLLASEASKPHTFANKIKNFMQAIKGGARPASISFAQDATADVSATGTITMSSNVAADTVTVGVTVLTASSTLQDATHYKIGADDTATAANLATCINANTTTNKQVLATAAAGVVTVTASRPGVNGNLVALAISAHGSVSAATLASGANAAPTAPVTFSFGL